MERRRIKISKVAERYVFGLVTLILICPLWPGSCRCFSQALDLLQPENAAGNAFSHICVVCLSVCPVCALTFQNLDLETLFLVYRYVFGISRSHLYVKVIG